jgi:hypothetical protein
MGDFVCGFASVPARFTFFGCIFTPGLSWVLDVAACLCDIFPLISLGAHRRHYSHLFSFSSSSPTPLFERIRDITRTTSKNWSALDFVLGEGLTGV